MPTMVLYQGSGEWSALYVDGILDRVGDHYLADERIAELAGVEVIQSDAFLRGGESRSDVAATLFEISQYSHDRAQRDEMAEKLRAKAAELLAEAEQLEK